MHTLRFKILAVAAALIVLSQLGTVATVLLTARNDVGERAAQTMHRAASIITETTESRANQFEDTVIALAADYGFRQAIATEDKPTAESALNNNVKRAGADIALLFNNDQDAELRPLRTRTWRRTRLRAYSQRHIRASHREL